MYRDDAAALEERGAALEEQLAPLRAAGPPGAMVRIAELERQRRDVRRFVWPYATLLALVPLFLRGLSGYYDAIPLGACALSLYLELLRQRRAFRLRRDAQDARDTQVRQQEPVKSADLGQVLAHHEALARELAVYRASGSTAEVRKAEETLEGEALTRHGRSFTWLAAALLVLFMPLTLEDPVLPIVIGALGLVLAGFAARIWSHRRALSGRLALARRELELAERALPTSQALPEQERAVQRTRRVVRERGEGMETATQRVSRPVLTVLATAVGVTAELRMGNLGSGAIAFLAVLGLVGTVALVYAVREGAALAARKRALRLATRENEVEEERLRTLRIAASAAAAPLVRIAEDVAEDAEENVSGEELSPAARYAHERELP